MVLLDMGSFPRAVGKVFGCYHLDYASDICYNRYMTYEIILPSGMQLQPDKYELHVAKVLAEYFKSDVRFIPKSNRPTPDILVVSTGDEWEIKNIRGNGKHTIEDNLREASRQSKNVVISLLKPTKMDTQRAVSRIDFFLGHGHRTLRRVILVTKQGKVIDIL